MTFRLAITISAIMVLYSEHVTDMVPVISTVSFDGETVDVKDTQQEARRLWDLALAAKGGRKLLYAVRNIVVSLTGEYETSSHKKNKMREDVFVVFPNKIWSWSDYRPDVFGMRIEMYNFDANLHYIINPDYPRSIPKPIIGMPKSESYTYGLVSYLLEARWLKPVPIRATSGKIGDRALDIVETKLDDKRIDFAFDRQTHLAVRVSYFNTYNNKTTVTVVNLSDYTEVAGIKVPQTSQVEDGGVDRIRIQINVEYDESIFVKPPPIDAGPEAWRPKK